MSHALTPRDPNTSSPRKPQSTSKVTNALEFPKSHQEDSLSSLPPTSHKRAHSTIDQENEPQDPDDISDDDPRLEFITEDCGQIRRKINTFINNGGMRVGQFQDAIGVSSNAYGRFMKQTGKFKGDGCDTYFKAAVFFKKREIAGVPMPKASANKKAKTSVGKDGKGGANDENKWDVSDIRLEGESEGKVPVYETCDSMRRMTAAHLRRDGITQASFCRELSKCLGDGGKAAKVSAGQLSGFLGKHGPRAGNQAAAFYAAYVYFEKLRVKAGKTKSKFREEMEERWAVGGENCCGGMPGFDIETSSAQGFWCRGDQRPYEDKYGIVHFG